MSTVLSIQAQPEARITVSYTVNFSTDLDTGVKLDVGGRTDEIVYVSQRGERYQVENSLSTLSKEQFEKLYENLEKDPSPEAYLRYAFERLKEIASAPQGPETEWLRSFLRKCSASPERRTLDELLRRLQ